MEKGIVKYHLDELASAGMARLTSSNYNTGHVYWNLTPAGRKYAVEHKLI
jgi:DNA-binding HxlR family transcriptional regulator